MTSVEAQVRASEDAPSRKRRPRVRLRNPFTAVRERRALRAAPDMWVARERRRRRLRLLVALLAVAAVGAGVWSVWFSPLFAVNSVTVVGLSPESEPVGADSVRASAAVSSGSPLVRVDTVGAQSRVAQLPWIESVQVYRSWPSAIVIEVVERTPVGVVEQGEARRGIDASGVVFDPPGGLWLTDPVIRGEEVALAEAVEVVVTLPEEIARRVRAVQAVSPDDIRLQLGNDAIVRWGNADEAEFKAQVLMSLLPRRAQAYDVSAPQLPTTFGEKGPRD